VPRSRMPEANPSARRPTFLLALVPVVALVALLYVNVRVFESADSQVPLVLATAVATLVGVGFLKRTWSDIEDGIVRSIGMAMRAILILLVIGMLIASWIQAGVVPLLIVYGLKLISPAAFLVTCCLVCRVVSLASGSSWTTAGTVGVALMGIGATLGVSPGMVAGAVVSGAYFGDKMSPLSDTTNLAPAMAGSTLVEHIRHMVWTVTPSLLAALGVYVFLGRGAHDAGGSLERVNAVIATIETRYVLSPWLLVPPVLILGLVVSRFPALPALVIGTFAGTILGLAVQPMASFTEGVREAFGVLFGGCSLDLVSSLPAEGVGEARREAALLVQSLFHEQGGMRRMLPTIALVICALSFGGVMERTGLLGALAEKLLTVVRGAGSLIAVTLGTCIGVNVLASDQYMAIVIPGRMYRTAFLKRGLHPKNLSRALEDSATVTSPLVPWNTCGAQMSAVLGVATMAYAPWAVLNWLCPLVSLFYGATGISITRIPEEEAKRRLEEGE